jgi:hypothetical protein
VGSRVHGAASACLVASGLFLCGLGVALALADPSSSPEVPGSHSDQVPDRGPKTDPEGSGSPATKTDDKPDTGETETAKPGYGGIPSNGDCGNAGSNGNARHCGGSSQSSSPTTPTNTSTKSSVTTPTTEPSPSTTPGTSTQASSSETTTTEPSTETSSRETSSETTSSPTTTTTTEPSESTTPTTTTPLGLPPPGGGGDGGGAIEVPSGIPELPPDMQLPPAAGPSVLDAVPGVGAAAADLPIPPITLPVIVAPLGLGAGGGGGSPGSPALPAAPRGVTAKPPAGREPLPANVGSNVAVPASSYRIGYTDYLRDAGLSQVAALAVPGVAGMLVLTGAGGLVGYRQAKAGHAVHTSGTARFVN